MSADDTSRELFLWLPAVDEAIRRALPPDLLEVTPAPRGLVSADTLGWDVVRAIRGDKLAPALRAAQPDSLDVAIDFGQDDRISCRLGRFEIATGGSGQNVNLSAPVLDGTLAFEDETYDLAPGRLEIQVRLELVDAPAPATGVGASAGTRRTLRVAPSPIEVLGYTSTLDHPRFVPALVVGGFTSWWKDHGDRLSPLELATVTLDRKLDSFPWLDLTDASYAFVDEGSGGTLAVLGMTQGHDAGHLFHEVSSAAVPTGADGALLVSTPQLVDDSLLPGLATAFVDASADDFEIVGDGDQVVLREGRELALPPVMADGNPYHVSVVRFDLTVEEDQIVTFLEATAKIGDGIRLYVDLTTYQGLQLVTKTDGSPTLGYVTTRPTETRHRIHNSDGVIVGKVLLALILSLAGGVSGALAKTIAQKIVILIVASIIKGAIAAAEAVVPDVLDHGIAAAMPPLDDLLATADGAVTWKGLNTTLDPTGARLDGSLQISGSQNDE